MADLVKLKTGTISKLGQKDSGGNPVIPLEAGSVYFAVDTTNHKGKIVYDAPKSNGVDRIVMSTDAENADHATNASNADKASQAAQLINTRKIDGINFNGTADVLHYAVCATAADTAAKTVSINNFNLATGARVSVRFSTTNTAVNPTLNVSNSGAKPIFYNGSAITAGYLLADKVWDFVYDADLNSNSGAWVLVGEKDTNTTYGEATSNTAGLMSASDKASYDIIKSNYLNGLTTDSANHKLTFTYGLGKVATDRALDFVKLAGDTLDSGAILSWPDSGNYANNNSGTSFPVDRGGLKWAGQNDGIYLHGVETAANNLDLQLKFTNDDSNGLSIYNSTNAEVIRLGANGNLMASGAGTLDGALTVGGTTTLNGALIANGTATIGQTLMVNGATTHKATVTFANNTPNVVGDDVQFGDFNKAGTLGIQGLTGTTAISLLARDVAWSPDSDKGTLSYDGSNLILDKRIKVPSAGGTFLVGKTIGNASINITTDITKDSYYPLLAVKNYNNHVWNIGGINNNVGIYGYYADRTKNGTDYSTVWDLNSGWIMHSGGLQVGGGTRLQNILTVSGATIINNSLTTTGTTTLNNMSNFARTSITSGTVAGMRTSLLLYGETYGDDATNLAKAGQLSYGDPGPQIVFNTVNNFNSGQPLALIYTDNDTISPGVSLSLVSNQSDAWFIAPHIKALSGFTGELTGNASSATQLKTARLFQTHLESDAAYYFNGRADCAMGVTGTLPVNHGGTGVTTLTTGYALIGNGTSAVQTRPIKNITSVNALGWTSGDTSLINSNTLAYWNGAYADTDSNILYTAVGQLGDVATVNKNGSITKFLRGDGNWAGVAQLVHQEKTIATTDWVESSITTNGITYPYCYSFDATGVTTDDTIAWLEITSGQQAGDMLISTGTAKISIYTTVKPDAEIGIKAWYIGEGVEGDVTLTQYEQLAQKVETTMKGAMLFFAGATAPTDTSGRTAWLDTANNRLKFYWDDAWRAVNTWQ